MALPLLSYLDLSNNKIDVIQEKSTLFEIPNLEFLSLENNNLRTIPPELVKVNHLKTLLIAGNPQKGISTFVIQQVLYV